MTALAGGALGPAWAVSPEQIAGLYRPFLADKVTLSADGLRVAYTEHSHDELRVVIMRLDPPYAKINISVADDRGLAFSKEKEPATLQYLKWATADRLVFAVTPEAIRLPGPGGLKYIEPIMAVNADGKNPMTLMDGKDFAADIDSPRPPYQLGRTSEVVGFLGGDREHLVVRAVGFPRGSRAVPTTAFKVDVHTGKNSVVSEELFPGKFCYDQQGKMRFVYLEEQHSLKRTFEFSERPSIKFNEAWLGPSASRFTLTTDNYFGERAVPLGFDLDPNVMYFASNVGKDTFGVYALNLQTKQRTDLALEMPYVDLVPLEPVYPAPTLVYDEYRGELVGARSPGPRPVTVWRDPDLAKVQMTVERQFPQGTVEILEWSQPRTVFLLRVRSGMEPGRYFVYRKERGAITAILRSAPWLTPGMVHKTEFVEFDTAAGTHLTGYLTLPGKVRLNPPPVVIRFADGLPGKPHEEFDREAQVLASMGLIVMRLNQRGVTGSGIRQRESLLAGLDRGPVEDAVAALDWLAKEHPIDRKRVAVMGEGFGGYLAVRALQLHPDEFRCAVAFNAPLDPDLWVRPEVNADMGVTVNFQQEVNRAFLKRGTKDLGALSVLAHPEKITNPVFLLLDPTKDDMIASANSRLRSALNRQQTGVEYVEVNTDFGAELPEARTQAYGKLEEFFNLSLYNYNVKVGPAKEVK